MAPGPPCAHATPRPLRNKPPRPSDPRALPLNPKPASPVEKGAPATRYVCGRAGDSTVLPKLSGALRSAGPGGGVGLEGLKKWGEEEREREEEEEEEEEEKNQNKQTHKAFDSESRFPRRIRLRRRCHF